MKRKEIMLENFETSPELAEVKVVYRTKMRDKVKICNSKDAFRVLFALYDKDTIEYQEQFYLLLLNKGNIVLGWIKLSSGGTAGTVVDPKIIFALAIKTNATSIILCHNHPSGNLAPSQADTTLTTKIKEGAKLMDLELLDHLLVANGENYYSFADQGML